MVLVGGILKGQLESGFRRLYQLDALVKMSQVQERDRHDSGDKVEPEGALQEPQSQAVAKASIEKAQFEFLIRGFSSLCVAVCLSDSRLSAHSDHQYALR
jgi:hypothetical protein